MTCETCGRVTADRTAHPDFVVYVNGQRYELRSTDQGTALVPVCTGGDQS